MGGFVTKPSSKQRKFHKHYILNRELGSGAFSVVKLAVNKDTHEQVAVKIVSKKKLTEDDLAALKTEIDILSHLNHPHIIKLFEVFEDGNDYYIVTELVQGGELFDRIVQKSHYSEKEARDLIKLFIETIAYMHEANVVHRDLKPENLLLTSEDDNADMKIADFGFAKRISELSIQEVACGTPGYVAPEILRGDSYGAEVDIWSIGVICYVLLVGYPPFYDDDQKKLFKKIKEAKYYFHEDYWSHISPNAIDLIRKMLCLDQSKRWTARQLLTHPWITAADEELAAKSLASSVEQLKKYNARRRLRAAADTILMANRIKRLTEGALSTKEGLSTKVRSDSVDDAGKESVLSTEVEESGKAPF